MESHVFSSLSLLSHPHFGASEFSVGINLNLVEDVMA